MKHKWLRITLTALLTLLILVGVGAAGYRLGLTQNPEVIAQLTALRAQRYAQAQKFVPQSGDTAQQQQSNTINPHDFARRDYSKMDFDRHDRFDRRDGFASPLFGLLHLALLGGLGWLGYKYVKNSGWKLVREAQPAPVVEEQKDAE